MALGDLLGDVFGDHSEETAAALRAYGAERGLELTDGHGLPDATPLLKSGDRRRADFRLDGLLAKNTQGSIALFTTVDVYHDAKGRRHRSFSHYTVAVTRLPRPQKIFPRLICQRRSGFRALDGFEDKVMHSGLRRVELESESFDKRYEVFIGEKSDANPVRQLFSPTFILWLADTAPEGFAFEFCAGVLCANLEGHLTEPAKLDGLRDGLLEVVGVLREEAREDFGPAQPRRAG